MGQEGDRPRYPDRVLRRGQERVLGINELERAPADKQLANPATTLVCEPQPWNHKFVFESPDPINENYFGFDVALEGNVAVIGDPRNDTLELDAGGVFIYRFDGANWIQEAILFAPDGARGDQFGKSLAMVGESLAIGAPTHNGNGLNAGAVYLFRFDGATWNFEQKVVSTDIEPFDEFGFALDMHEQSLIVGVPLDDDAGSHSGSAYVFRFDTTSGQWEQRRKLVPTSLIGGERFGSSVAISENVVLVGAPKAPDTGENGITNLAYAYPYNATIDKFTGGVQKLLPTSFSPRGTSDFDSEVTADGNLFALGVLGNHVFIYRIADQSIQRIEHISDAYIRNGEGRILDLRGNRLAAGRDIFEYDGADWSRVSELDVPGPNIMIIHSVSINDPSDPIHGNRILYGTQPRWRTYTHAGIFEPGPFPDCNENGIADYCDTANGATDCNRNSVPDECEVAAGTIEDCNNNGIDDVCDRNIYATSNDCSSNGIPDECEIADGSAIDCDGNGVPDYCETDCNRNGIGDACEITDGSSPDCDGNGVPDECDHDCDENGLPDACDLAENDARDTNLNGIIDSCECPVQIKLRPSFISERTSFGNAVDIDRDLAIVGSQQESNENGDGAGAAYIFRRKGLNWLEEARLVDPIGAPNNFFGYEVAISGDIALVFALQRTNSPTASHAVLVYRYHHADRQWIQEAELVETPTSWPIAARFGWRMDVFDETLAIFANLTDKTNLELATGHAMIYEHNEASGWAVTAQLPLSFTPNFYEVPPRGNFGLRGNRFISGMFPFGFGVMGEEPGVVFIHGYDGKKWVQEAQLYCDLPNKDDTFGTSADIDGNVAIIGNPGSDEIGENFGAVHIYRFGDSGWHLEQNIFPPDGTEILPSGFGRIAIIRGNTAIISLRMGNRFDIDLRYALLVYKYNPDSGQWNYERKIQAFDGKHNTGFDNVIDADQESLIVSSLNEEIDSVRTKAVYIISGLFGPDCNANLEPDACDIHFGRAEDVNANVIPDTCELLGDINVDGKVNVTDLLLLLAGWGDCSTPCPGDINADEQISYLDLLILISNWGRL